MDHAIDIAVEADEQAELGDVLDLAFDIGARRIFRREGFPRIVLDLLEAQRNAALGGVDFEHLHFNFFRGRKDLAGMHVLLGPAHFRDMDEAFDAVFKLDERAVVGDVGDVAPNPGANRIFAGDAFPWILVELLHAERNALGLGIDADDLHLHGLADGQDIGGMIDALPGDVGDMEQAVDAAQIDEGAVIGDVLDHAVNHLAFGKILHQLRALFGAGFFHDGAARDDDIAAAAVHLENLEGLGHMHQRAHIADRADINLAAGQERHGAAEIDGEAALDAAEDHAIDALILGAHFFETGPGLLAAGLVARQHRFAERILDALEINFNRVAGLDRDVLAGLGEFLERDAAFGFETDIDDHEIVFDGHDAALDDHAFGGRIVE